MGGFGRNMYIFDKKNRFHSSSDIHINISTGAGGQNAPGTGGPEPTVS